MMRRKKDKKVFVSPQLSFYTEPTFPEHFFPQLATLVKQPPRGNNWLHEIKFDGYRIIAHIDKKVKLLTRDQHDWTQKFLVIENELKKLKLFKTILDGEVVAFDEKNISNFQRLQNTLNHQNQSPLYYYVFDLLFFQGEDLTHLPLIERKKVLKKVLSKAKNKFIRFSDHIIGQGNWVFEKSCQALEEGIISKEINSPYLAKRTKSWLKIKCINRQEFVICGFTSGKGKRKHFGSLLLGYYSADKKLCYCGHVGTGFNEKTLAEIADYIKKYSTEKMPFAIKPKLKNPTFWLKPKLVAEVEFRSWTDEGMLRHASFKGLRLDKAATDVVRES